MRSSSITPPLLGHQAYSGRGAPDQLVEPPGSRVRALRTCDPMEHRTAPARGQPLEPRPGCLVAPEPTKLRFRQLRRPGLLVRVELRLALESLLERTQALPPHEALGDQFLRACAVDRAPDRALPAR